MTYSKKEVRIGAAWQGLRRIMLSANRFEFDKAVRSLDIYKLVMERQARMKAGTLQAARDTEARWVRSKRQEVAA